jgi:hypothetical protein
MWVCIPANGTTFSESQIREYRELYKDKATFRIKLLLADSDTVVLPTWATPAIERSECIEPRCKARGLFCDNEGHSRRLFGTPSALRRVIGGGELAPPLPIHPAAIEREAPIAAEDLDARLAARAARVSS